jgi:hypothetical protein
MGRAHRKVPRSEGGNGLAADVTEFLRLFKSMVDPYRPELHYMRGPGPKWRAKHATRSLEVPSMHGLARIER